MENYESVPALELSQEAESYLEEIRKWAKLLAIFGFIGIGLIVIFGLFITTFSSGLGGGLIPFPGYLLALLYIAIAALYFFPLFYLIKFASKINAAFASRESADLDLAFKNLKSHYKYIGNFTIAIIIIYAIVFVIIGVMASMF